MSTSLLEVTGLRAGYGPAVVVEDIGFRLSPGEPVLLAGRNGAGKSTLLKTLCGLLPAQGGTVRLAGQALLSPGQQPPAHRIARAGIGYVPEERRVFAELSVAENLIAGTRHGPGPVWDEAGIMALFPALEPLRRRRAGLLSGGEQQMLTIARTLMGAPSLLLLDEPSEGLAPLIVDTMRRAMTRLAGSGLTILMAEQNWHFASRLATRIMVLERGRLVHDGPMAAFSADPALQSRLLGAG